MLTTSNFILTLQILILRFTFHELSIQCPDVPKLEILPGFGLDSLTNKETKQMFSVSYNQCKLTKDENHLIPDNVDLIRFNTTEITGNVMQHWLNFTSITRFNEINDLYHSFSDDYQEMKYLQVKYRAFTCQSQLVQTIYRVSLSSPTINSYLKSKFIALIYAVNKNEVKNAKYLAQTIIRDYGTHFISSVDIGKMFTKEDYLKMDFLNERIDQDETLVTESKLSLLETARFSWGHKQELNSSLLSEYNDAIIESKLRYIGSETPEMINRSVYLISNLVITKHFPKVSNELLKKVRQLLNDEIRNYFEKNSHSGCTDPKSTNFVYIANIDDNSCQYNTFGYKLGGFYQLDVVKNQNGSSGQNLKNSLTGETNCPSGFSNLLLHKNVQHETYYCITNSTVNKFYLFGGLYSKDVDNIQTKGKNCPPLFKPIFILDSKLAICVNKSKPKSSDEELNLLFGGFATCSTEFQCPIGFQKQLAVKLDIVNIYYCVLQTKIEDFGLIPLLLRPPYINLDDNENFIDDESFNEDYGDYFAINLHSESNELNGKINFLVFLITIIFNIM